MWFSTDKFMSAKVTFFSLRTRKGSTPCFSIKKSDVGVVFFKFKLYLKDSVKLIKNKFATARLKFFVVTRISGNKSIFLFGLSTRDSNILISAKISLILRKFKLHQEN